MVKQVCLREDDRRNVTGKRPGGGVCLGMHVAGQLQMGQDEQLVVDLGRQLIIPLEIVSSDGSIRSGIIM